MGTAEPEPTLQPVYQRLFHANDEALLAVGDDARILAANPAATRILGRSRDDLEGARLAWFLDPVMGDPDAVAEGVARGARAGRVRFLTRGGQSVTVEVRRATANGGVPAVLRLRPLSARPRIHGARLRRILGAVTQAVTEAPTLPGAYSATVAAVCANLPGARAAIHVVDATDGSLRLAASQGLPDALAEPWGREPMEPDRNPTAQAALGHATVRVEAPWTDLRADAANALDAAGIRAGVMAPLQTGGRLVGVLSVWTTSEDALREADSPVVAMLADSAAQAIAHRASRDSLTHRSDELDTLVSAVGHDLQEPLRGVRGLMDLAREELPRDPDAAAELLDQARQAATRLQTRLTGLLDVARATHTSRTVAWVSLDALAQEVVAAQRQSLQAVGGAVDIERPLPVVCGSPSLLQEALANLISNALRHNDSDTPRVRLSCRDRGDAWEVAVADNGPGVPLAVRQSLAEGATRLPHDDGVGLTIVRSVVAQHGGRLWAEASDLGGAAFHFTLPKHLACLRG